MSDEWASRRRYEEKPLEVETTEGFRH